MTPIQIAYFKHFMYDKGLERSFQRYYHTCPIKGSPRGDKDGNPESIEEYLLQTTVEDVIMKAFIFYPSGTGNSSYEYWKGIDEQWQAYIKMNESNFSNDSWPNLRKSFAILRQNWDIPYYWRKENLESTEEVYKRMKIDLPLPIPELCWKHGYQPNAKRGDSGLIDYDIHNAKDGDFVVRTRQTKNGGIVRTIFIIKEVVPYDPLTSELTPQQLHRDFDPAKNNIYIAYLHARYTSNGESFRTDFNESLHSVIDDECTTEKYRIAFKEEENIMTLKLADEHLAWNPATKTIVPLLDALKAKNDEEEPLIDFDTYSDPLADIEFVELDHPSKGLSLREGTISVNIRSGSFKISFSRNDSKRLKERNFVYARLGKVGGSIVIMLNYDQGVRVAWNDGYMNINSKALIEKLRELLDIKERLVYLNIEKISDCKEYITYKLTK